MKLTFIGAAHEVTGSCHYLEACGKNILIDCGMEQGQDIYENVDLPMLGLFRHLYSPERRASKTIFVVLKEEQEPVLCEIIDHVTGGLDNPDSGIAFSVSLDMVKGVGKNNG